MGAPHMYNLAWHVLHLVEKHEAPLALGDGVNNLLRDLRTLPGEADHAVRRDEHPSLPKQAKYEQKRAEAGSCESGERGTCSV